MLEHFEAKKKKIGLLTVKVLVSWVSQFLTHVVYLTGRGATL